jgi:hypothetical protein
MSKKWTGPFKFRNIDPGPDPKNPNQIPTVNPRNLIVGQDYLIQHIKEGLPSIFLLHGLSAQQQKALIEKVITRFRGRFVKYITSKDTKLKHENPLMRMPIEPEERVAVFEDVDIISKDDKNIFPEKGIYVIKNTETPTKHVIGTAYLEHPDKSVKDTQFKELIKERKYYTGFDISTWIFAPTISRKIIRNAFNQLVNQPQDPKLSDEDNKLIDFRRDVVSMEGITELMGEYLETDVPQVAARETLDPVPTLNSRFNDERIANAKNINAEYANEQNANEQNANEQNANEQNANQQNVNTRKRGPAEAQLVAREYTEVDGGSRRRKTRRRKMRKNKTRSKRRKHTKRHRK